MCGTTVTTFKMMSAYAIGIFQYNNVLCSVISLEQACIEHPFGQLQAPGPIASTT